MGVNVYKNAAMATVAQLVEHSVVVRVVAGSSPVGRPILTRHYLFRQAFLYMTNFGTYERFHLYRRAINRQLFNPTTVKHREFDCHIATAKLCGTHWIKYMLSLALAERYDLAPPAHIKDDSIVGHTKNPPRHAHIPQIAVTHSHPHYLLRVSNIFRVLDLPKFVVLVRDPRDILVSMYEKNRGEHLKKKMSTEDDVSFSQFIRGDVTGNTRIGDIWQIILFFNAWGPVVAAQPENVMPVRYEDLKGDTAGTLRKICDHAGLRDIPDDVLARAVAGSSKEHMRQKLDKSEDVYDKSVNLGQRNFKSWYDAGDRSFLEDTCKRYLRCDFGYKLDDWS